MSEAALARAIPALFVLLWSSAFVAVRMGLPDISPLYFLFLRFVLAASVLGTVALLARQDWSALAGRWHHFVLAGVLINGIYLACSYLALARISAATIALIGSLHPIAVALLSGHFLGERFRARQWCGMAFGVAGVALVVGVKADDLERLEAMAIALAGVGAFVAGTLYYARHCRAGALVPANTVQLGAAAVVAGAASFGLEDVRAEWSAQAVATLLYLTFAISLGGMALLLYMLKRGQAGQVSANFYLTPGTTAVLGWLVLGEDIGWGAGAGFLLATIGVWLVNRPISSLSRPASRRTAPNS